MLTFHPLAFAEIIATGSSSLVPSPIAKATWWLWIYVSAVRELTTIAAVVPVAKLGPAWFASPVGGPDWALTYRWDYDMSRAFDFQLAAVT